MPTIVWPASGIYCSRGYSGVVSARCASTTPMSASRSRRPPIAMTAKIVANAGTETKHPAAHEEDK